MKVRRFNKLSIMLAVLVFYSDQNFADIWQQTGDGSVSIEYDSNPVMSPANPIDVRRTIFEPTYTLTGNIGQNKLRTGLALQLVRSSNNTLSQNRDSPNVFLDWQRQTVTGEFGISSRYTETATRVAEIGSTSPGVTDSIRSSRNLSGKWSNALSDRSTLSADSSYESVSYSDSNYVNYSGRSASMTYGYDWSEFSSPFIQLFYTDYESTGVNALNLASNSVFAGWNWKISESLESNMKIGNSSINNTDIGSGMVTMHYTGQQSQLGLNAGRKVSPSALGGFVTIDQANGSWSYAMNERSKAGIDLMWQNNHLNIEIVNRSAGAWLQHDLNSFWNARLYYQYRTTEQVGIDAAYSHMLGMSFIYTHADF